VPKAAAILAPGEELGGFQIISVIGFGGMAVVYLAEQLSLGRQVALKVLSPQLSGDADFRERFRREGKNVAALDHPNIVPIYDSGEYNGRLYLAMRLVVGSTLGERMLEAGLSAAETMAILRPIANALDVAHAARLVHRDVKPQNILLTADDHPYLADFGVAKGPETHGLTATGGFIGSLNYAAPEQILGRPTTPAGDVYALTAVLYQCLTGQVPYPRETDAGVMHAHLNEPPPTLLGSDEIETQLSDVIARGMAKDPEDRYTQAGELIAAAAGSLAALPAGRREDVPAFPTSSRADVDTSLDSAVVARRDGDGEARARQSTGGVVLPGSRPVATPDPGQPRSSDHTDILAPSEQRSPARPTDSTTADRRRRAPATTNTESERSPKRRWPLAVAVAGVALAAGAAIAVALPGSSDHHVASGPLLAVSYSAPWKLSSGPSATEASLLASPISLVAGSSTVSAGQLRVSASVPGGAPPQLADALGKPASQATVQIAGDSARRYVWQGPRGSQTLALVLATQSADLAVVCRSPGSSMAACSALADTVRVHGVAVQPPGANAGLEHVLDSELTPVGVARIGLDGQTVADLPSRAAAAEHAEHLELAAESAISASAVPTRNRGAVTGMAIALRSEARAWGQLASAASHDQRGAYVGASAAVTAASGAVETASQTLRTQGFASPALLRPTLPGLPVDLEQALVRYLTPVSTARAGFSAQASATQLPTRSASAKDIALAETTAAAALSALALPAHTHGLITAMASAMRAEAREWTLLASAAAADARTSYATASTAVTDASRRLQSATDALHAPGSSPPALLALTMPGLPAVSSTIPQTTTTTPSLSTPATTKPSTTKPSTTKKPSKPTPKIVTSKPLTS
jgi:serine/threonine protein kinase